MRYAFFLGLALAAAAAACKAPTGPDARDMDGDWVGSYVPQFAPNCTDSLHVQVRASKRGRATVRVARVATDLSNVFKPICRGLRDTLTGVGEVNRDEGVLIAPLHDRTGAWVFDFGGNRVNGRVEPAELAVWTDDGFSKNSTRLTPAP